MNSSILLEDQQNQIMMTTIGILLTNEQVPREIFKSAIDQYFGPQHDDFIDSSLGICVLNEQNDRLGSVACDNNCAAYVKSQWLYVIDSEPNSIFEFRLGIYNKQNNQIIAEEDSLKRVLVPEISHEDIFFIHTDWNSEDYTTGVELKSMLYSMDDSLMVSNYEPNQTDQDQELIKEQPENPDNEDNDSCSYSDSLKAEEQENQMDKSFEEMEIPQNDVLTPEKEVSESMKDGDEAIQQIKVDNEFGELEKDANQHTLDLIHEDEVEADLHVTQESNLMESDYQDYDNQNKLEIIHEGQVENEIKLEEEASTPIDQENEVEVDNQEVNNHCEQDNIHEGQLENEVKFEVSTRMDQEDEVKVDYQYVNDKLGQETIHDNQVEREIQFEEEKFISTHQDNEAYLDDKEPYEHEQGVVHEGQLEENMSTAVDQDNGMKINYQENEQENLCKGQVEKEIYLDEEEENSTSTPIDQENEHVIDYQEKGTNNMVETDNLENNEVQICDNLPEDMISKDSVIEQTYNMTEQDDDRDEGLYTEEHLTIDEVEENTDFQNLEEPPIMNEENEENEREKLSDSHFDTNIEHEIEENETENSTDYKETNVVQEAEVEILQEITNREEEVQQFQEPFVAYANESFEEIGYIRTTEDSPENADNILEECTSETLETPYEIENNTVYQQEHDDVYTEDYYKEGMSEDKDVEPEEQENYEVEITNEKECEKNIESNNQTEFEQEIVEETEMMDINNLHTGVIEDNRVNEINHFEHEEVLESAYASVTTHDMTADEINEYNSMRDITEEEETEGKETKEDKDSLTEFEDIEKQQNQNITDETQNNSDSIQIKPVNTKREEQEVRTNKKARMMNKVTSIFGVKSELANIPIKRSSVKKEDKIENMETDQNIVELAVLHEPNNMDEYKDNHIETEKIECMNHTEPKVEFPSEETNKLDEIIRTSHSNLNINEENKCAETPEEPPKPKRNLLTNSNEENIVMDNKYIPQTVENQQPAEEIILKEQSTTIESQPAKKEENLSKPKKYSEGRPKLGVGSLPKLQLKDIPTQEEIDNKENSGRLYVNDDNKYPDSITPTKVDKKLVNESNYDIPFMDDNEVSQADDSFKANNRNSGLGLPNNSQQAYTPRASIESFKDAETPSKTNLHVPIDASPPPKKKKKLFSFCGCMGSKVRS